MSEARPVSILAAPDRSDLTLLELADRLLNRGVVITGEATISVAGVDLIYLGLNVLLTSVETMRAHVPGAEAPVAAAAPGAAAESEAGGAAAPRDRAG